MCVVDGMRLLLCTLHKAAAGSAGVSVCVCALCKSAFLFQLGHGSSLE